MNLEGWTLTDYVYLTITEITDEEQEEIQRLNQERASKLSSLSSAETEKRDYVNTTYDLMIASIRRNSKGEKKTIKCKPLAINENGEFTETSVYERTDKKALSNIKGESQNDENV